MEEEEDEEDVEDLEDEEDEEARGVEEAEEGKEEEVDEVIEEDRWDFLASSLYVFAMTYLVDALVMATIRGWVARLDYISFPTAATVTRVFENVPVDSPLCELFVDDFVQRVLSGDFVIEPGADGLDEMPVGFTAAVQEALDSRQSDKRDDLIHLVGINSKFSQSINPTANRHKEETWDEVLVTRMEASEEAAASMKAKITDKTVEIDKLKKEMEELKKAA